MCKRFDCLAITLCERQPGNSGILKIYIKCYMLAYSISRYLIHQLSINNKYVPTKQIPRPQMNERRWRFHSLLHRVDVAYDAVSRLKLLRS